MIEVINLNKSYKNKKIFQDVNLQIKSNKISFFLGKNGAGKTTLIKCLFNLEKYDGNILFDGNKVDSIRSQSCVVWDDTPLYTDLSGKQNLYIFSSNNIEKSKIHDIAEKYLDSDLMNQKVEKYSYGQKKKLMLALVEILNPKYLIMDEVSNGLDYETIIFVKDKIKQWSSKMDIILTGHQFEFYNGLVDDIYIIDNEGISLYEEDCSNKNIDLGDVYNEKLYNRES